MATLIWLRPKGLIEILIFSTFFGFSCSLFKKKDKFEKQSNENILEEGQVSSVSGIPYNDTTIENSFIIKDFSGQINGPNLVFIEGGAFAMGMTEEDIFNVTNTQLTTVNVASFYMDRTEIANIHWLEFMNYYQRNPGTIPDGLSFEEYNQKVLLPDTTVWSSESAMNDAYVNNYLRYPGFRMFPVVGVSWIQAQEFCKWRTQMVNRVIETRQQYTGLKLNNKIDRGGWEETKQDTTSVKLPGYRLPTEAEWEYAAKAMFATQYDDVRKTQKRLYPWDGRYTRNPYKKNMGQFMANFKRGRGDYAGIAGRQNDAAMLTEWIYAYPPNDFGLYNMAGNVNEWVEDTYYPPGWEEYEDLAYVKRVQNHTDSTLGKDKLVRLSRDILLYYPNAARQTDSTMEILDSTGISMDNFMTYPNSAGIKIPETDPDRRATFKVYKGGSWRDVAFWLSPGTRRFMEMDKGSATIGFRCAMSYQAPEKDAREGLLPDKDRDKQLKKQQRKNRRKKDKAQRQEEALPQQNEEEEDLPEEPEQNE